MFVNILIAVIFDPFSMDLSYWISARHLRAQAEEKFVQRNVLTWKREYKIPKV